MWVRLRAAYYLNVVGPESLDHGMRSEMRFGNLAGRLVLVTEAGAIDVARGSGGRAPSDPQAAFDQWDEVLAWAGQLSGKAVPFDDADLGPPSPRPRQVFGLAFNYADHAAEGGAPVPKFPIVFTKFPTCITSPRATVLLPSPYVDWEVELVVVIGRHAHRVRRDCAWSYVAGLTVGQDLSEREVQHRRPASQYSLGKSFPGFGPTGPVLVSPDEFDSPDDLELTCSLNGEEMQRGRTRELIFPVARLISDISAIVPLQPGDLVFTGTPSGIGATRTPPRFLRPGDELVSKIEGIGAMRNVFQAVEEDVPISSGQTGTPLAVDAFQ